MKLYATITSERATKGQGGNNKLVINITVGNKSRREIANIVLRTSGGCLKDPVENMYALEYYPVNREDITLAGRKGRLILDSGPLEEDYQSFLQPLQDFEKDDVLPTEKGEKKKGEICADRQCTNPEHKHSWMR